MPKKTMLLLRPILNSQMKCLRTASEFIHGSYTIFDFANTNGPDLYVCKVTIYASTDKDLAVLESVVDQVVRQNVGV